MESLEGSVYKICIIESKTRFLWMTMASTKKVDGVLDQWLKDNIPGMRAQHGLNGFKFQTDNEEFNSKAYKDLVAASGGKQIPTHLRACLLLSGPGAPFEKLWPR